MVRTWRLPIISAVRAGAASRDIEMKLSTPGGNPASSKASTTIACDLGLTSEHFMIVVLPHMMGTRIARIDKATGAFHGAIPKLENGGGMARQSTQIDGRKSARSGASLTLLLARVSEQALVLRGRFQTGTHPPSTSLPCLLRCAEGLQTLAG